ncbi:MAG: hypothetical protein WD431_10640, partial [Cyclobacteriaceae bacterium]
MKHHYLIDKSLNAVILVLSVFLLPNCSTNKNPVSEDGEKIVISNGHGIEFVLIKKGYRYGFQKTNGTTLVPPHPVSGLLAGSPDNLTQAESTKYLGETGGLYAFE